MARWTGTWLSGLGAAGIELQPKEGWRGRRLGLPEQGAGAMATTGARVAALFVDILVGGLIGGLVNVFVTDPSSNVRALAANGAFALQVLILTALTGQSVGMRLLGIRVARIKDPAAVPGFLPTAVRLMLLCLVLPALVFDRDGRGLHDKAAGTAVLRAKGAASFAQ